jgi:hypothetical protein
MTVVSKLKICQKLYDFNSWMLLLVNRFPASHRFLLGSKIFQLGFELMELSAQANQVIGQEREVLQKQLANKMDSLRLAIRLAKDLRLISYKQYSQAADRTAEITRMLNSWRKVTKVAKVEKLKN